MSLIGTAIGALVALLPAVRPDKADPRFVAGYDAGLKDGRLEAKDEKLARSQARLVDHIETLEREILIERHLCQHWKEEAERLAAKARQERELREAAEQQSQQYNSAMAQQAQQNQQAQQYAQYAYQNPHGLQNQQQAFEGFCNCVPSRAQVWAAQPLNDGS